jgi:hypothetical protein
MNRLRFATLLLFAAIPVTAATLTGKVRDLQGAVIPNARVVAHWNPIGSSESEGSAGEKQDTIVTTDSDGRFSVELADGIYDVLVTATAFSPHCEQIQLKNNERKKYQVKLKLSKFLPTVYVD